MSRFDLACPIGDMKTIGNWVLRVADSDLTWFGLNWLRPSTRTHIGIGYIFFSSVLLGLPGIVAGAAMIYLAIGKVQSTVWLALILLVMAIELPLHWLFAYFWNERARRLCQQSPAI